MGSDNQGVNIYKRHSVPPDIHSCAICLYHRFNRSRGDIEDSLGERGVTVSCE